MGVKKNNKYWVHGTTAYRFKQCWFTPSRMCIYLQLMGEKVWRSRKTILWCSYARTLQIIVCYKNRNLNRGEEIAFLTREGENAGIWTSEYQSNAMASPAALQLMASCEAKQNLAAAAAEGHRSPGEDRGLADTGRHASLWWSKTDRCDWNWETGCRTD